MNDCLEREIFLTDSITSLEFILRVHLFLVCAVVTAFVFCKCCARYQVPEVVEGNNASDFEVNSVNRGEAGTICCFNSRVETADEVLICSPQDEGFVK